MTCVSEFTKKCDEYICETVRESDRFPYEKTCKLCMYVYACTCSCAYLLHSDQIIGSINGSSIKRSGNWKRV